MTIKEWLEAERPREKLLSQGAHTLADSELLAILWRTGAPGKNVVDLARELLAKFGSLRQLLEAGQQELCQNLGIGSAKYVILQAAREISSRYLYSNLSEREDVSNTMEIKYYLSLKLRHKKQEVFACVFLDNKHRILGYEELFYGTINQANIYPREIIRRALHHNAAALIFAHNHPSGVAEPSSEDRQITANLTKALGLIDVRVLDHIVVGDEVIFSMLEGGLLK
jgi:DNA repair protein RadC